MIAEGISPNLYITHKVAPKENFYSIGRIYNISPRDIAPFNNITLESGLNPGQVLRVPLNTTNFFQSGTADADETFVPLYHIVSAKEGLYRIGVHYNNLPVETLKQWNNIKEDAVKQGSRLIVGYLKVKKELSDVAGSGIGRTIESNTAVVTTAVKPAQVEKQPEIKKADEATAVVKTKKEETALVKPVAEEVNVVKTVKKEPEINNKAMQKMPGGVFKSLYDNQNRETAMVTEEGNAGIFKSTSGWTDKKYYCLHNNTSPGTIVKVSNPANGKFVFAKVLDLIPDIKQNDGMMMIISNAAADELGVSENNFGCVITYSK